MSHSNSEVPVQKMVSLTSGNAYYNQFKSFSTLAPNSFNGKNKYEIFTEINFTDLFFSLLNDLFKINFNYELSIIMNHGWAGNSFKSDHIQNYSYTEVGFGINKLIGVIKLEFIWGINKINENYPFAFNIKADNFDIF